MPSSASAAASVRAPIKPERIHLAKTAQLGACASPTAGYAKPYAGIQAGTPSCLAICRAVSSSSMTQQKATLEVGGSFLRLSNMQSTMYTLPATQLG